jgi:hypothetical protein
MHIERITQAVARKFSASRVAVIARAGKKEEPPVKFERVDRGGSLASQQSPAGGWLFNSEAKEN